MALTVFARPPPWDFEARCGPVMPSLDPFRMRLRLRFVRTLDVRSSSSLVRRARSSFLRDEVEALAVAQEEGIEAAKRLGCTRFEPIDKVGGRIGLLIGDGFEEASVSDFWWESFSAWGLCLGA